MHIEIAGGGREMSRNEVPSGIKMGRILFSIGHCLSSLIIKIVDGNLVRQKKSTPYLDHS